MQLNEEVPRRSELSLQEFMQEYGLPGRPVVITDATRDWEALNWTPQGLVERYGDEIVEVTPSASMEEAQMEMSLAEYVEYVEAPDERLLYMTSWNFREVCPELLDDFEVPVYFREDWLQEIDPEQQFDLMWLFLGPAGAGFRMHVDLAQTSAWNCQLTGRKEWLLWPPEVADRLYEGEVDGFHPDLEAFPLYQGVRPLRTTLGPGELVFTPSGWWHQTRNLETGLAITANFANETNCQRVLGWLREVGVQLELGHDMVAYLGEFERVMNERIGSPS